MTTPIYARPVTDECKMQSDSVQLPSPGHIRDVKKQTATQGSLVDSLRCSKCTLIFKSKVYLFDHLNKVHCFDVDAALREAGLKYAGTKKANTRKTNSKSAGKSFKCDHCDFKATSWFVLNEHEKRCEKTENSDMTGTAIVAENPETNQHNGATETGETSSVLSSTSTSETQSMLTLSKDLKTYKRPSQTTNKDFAASSGSSGQLHVKLSDDPQGSPILHKKPSSSSSNSTGVIKVAAQTTIDITASGLHLLLQDGRLVNSDMRSQNPNEQRRESIRNVGKRTSMETPQALPAKKAKSGEEVKTRPETKDKNTQPSCSTEFSFEVSDDEEKNHREEPQRPKVYFCKQCDHSSVDFRRVCSHYQNDHPYVRYRAVYILNVKDQSATFRCLECPVEFLSTVDLKWHYTEKHPEAPDIFKMKSSEFNLIYKCFECPFTTIVSNALRLHYEKKHPLHQLDNSLLFCRYSLTKCQEEPCLKSLEKKVSPPKSGEITPQKANAPCEKVQNTPSPKHPSSKGLDTVLLQCNNCDFVHKSVVVMHVHYQKTHPDEAITIDKIRQLTFGTALTTLQVTPKKESPKEATGEQKDPQRISLSVPEQKPETSKYHTESPQSKKVDSVRVKSKRKMSSTQTPEKMTPEEKTPEEKTPEEKTPEEKTPEEKTPEEKTPEEKTPEEKTPEEKTPEEKTPGVADLLSSLSAEWFYCTLCDYSHPKLRSVVNHCCSKHSMERRITMEDIIKHSVEERKRKPNPRASKRVKAPTRRKVSADVSLEKCNPYEKAEMLFFCPECNNGNPTLVGILAHQLQSHKWKKTDRERILEYTAWMRNEIEKSKLDPKGSSSATRLPLPLMNEGDENKLFCHVCNYRRANINLVLRHCYRNHRGFPALAENIRRYTALVLKEVVEPHLKKAANQKNKTKAAKKLGTSSRSVRPSTTDSTQPSQRTLQCCMCKFGTECVFLLKRHMRKVHNKKRPHRNIIRMCFRQGNLQSGYHCEYCVFSHEEAEAVNTHYEEQHPTRLCSLKYVRTELYAGPEEQQTNTTLKPAAAARRAEGDERKMFSCSICSFTSSSKWNMAQHRQIVHSLSAKEDGSDVQEDKKASASSEVEDLNDMPGLFEAFQVPLEDPEEETAGCTLFKCPSCPASFNSQRGVSVHQGIKHGGLVIEEEPDKKQVQIHRRVHVFKCPHCPYVNTAYQGVLTHCQMRHPALPTRADSLHVDVTQLHNHDEYTTKKDSGETVKLTGYMCKTCQKICGSSKKLNQHRELHHNEDSPGSASNAFRAAPQTSAVSRKLLAKASGLQRVACQHCSFSCRTAIGLSHHIRIRHKHLSSTDFVYKCALCPQFYFNRKQLGSHYARNHGKNAFMKYYVPVCKKVLQMPAAPSQDVPSAQQFTAEEEEEDDGNKLVYRCPDCPYVNRSYHGTLTHCQMKHPDLVVQATGLEIGEIAAGSVVGSPYERGYQCKKCQQIHVSMKKLKVHWQKMHGVTAVSEQRTNAEGEEPDDSSRGCSSSPPPPGETPPGLEAAKKKTLYKCQICTYSAAFRGYLRCHYKNTHKLDALSMDKLLERYNKRKYKSIPRPAYSGTISKHTCIECPDFSFDSSQSLIDHYDTQHRLKLKSDFSVLSTGAKYKTTGIYRCRYCMSQLNGIKKLCQHLDRHRDTAMQAFEAATKTPPLVCATTSDPESSQPCRQDEGPAFESAAELNVTSLDSVAHSSSSRSSPSKVSVCEPEGEPKEADAFACDQCKRTFMSMKGLRLHEHSHAATAAIKKLNTVPSSQFNINKYVVHKAGILKGFLCGCCSYRTNLMGLWRCHFLKNHQDVIQKDNSGIKCFDEISQTAEEELSESEKMNMLQEFDEEAEESEASVYSEPPDVQRQLSHYSSRAQSNDNSENTQRPLESSLLHCEICNFETKHLSSIRRHYQSRHGKKIFKCKECGFVAGLRKTFQMHIEGGHHMCQSEPSHQKDLRCPFCLYQTKNKNNMIDHIVLHREERVMPIEVRRSKLSRYLEGIVFRCHRCTFTCGSAENLRLHMTRHDDVKPYKCRLCYFDCSHLSELEAHLNDKHQVLRNHQLVGQVSLEKLEARTGRQSEEEEEEEEQHETGWEDVEMQDFAPDSEPPQDNTQTQHTSTETIIPHTKEADGTHETRDVGVNATSYAEEKDLQTHAAALYSARVESSVEEKAAIVMLDIGTITPRGPERGDPSETEHGDEQHETPGEGSSTSVQQGNTAESLKLHLKICQQKSLNIQARVEDDILRQISLMGEDDGMCKTLHRPEESVRLEQSGGSRGLEKDPSENLSQDKNNGSLDQNSRSQVTANSISTSTRRNYAPANKIRPQAGFRFERHELTLLPIHRHFSLGDSFTNYRKEQQKPPRTVEVKAEPEGEMPVLENEYLKKEPLALEICKEVEEEAIVPDQKQEPENELITKDQSDQDDPHVDKGELNSKNGETEDLHPSCAEQKGFTCKFCGRSLRTVSELDLHVARHGL
ncbi:zinc finger protein 462-like isoform X2 [Cololabis saira]|nr:zinc finger protein 462-like isoform X2 [Cololabis saira]